MNTAITYPSGTVTVYGFACGYIEETDGPVEGVRLWLEGCWHVRRHHTSGTRFGYIRESWQTFDNLTDARKAYRREARRVLAGLPYDGPVPS